MFATGFSALLYREAGVSKNGFGRRRRTDKIDNKAQGAHRAADIISQRMF
jgi:hypothetical protein